MNLTLACTCAAERNKARVEQHGFITLEQHYAMARCEQHRLETILVRCGGQRALVPAQDVRKYIAGIEATGDYVRDLSFPAGRFD